MENNEEKKIYIYDIDKLFEFISKPTASKSRIDILESFERDEEDKLVLSSRQVNESKGETEMESNIMKMKYELIKDWFNVLSDLPSVLEDDNTGFGKKIIINTLLKEGILKEE